MTPYLFFRSRSPHKRNSQARLNAIEGNQECQPDGTQPGSKIESLRRLYRREVSSQNPNKKEGVKMKKKLSKREMVLLHGARVRVSKDATEKGCYMGGVDDSRDGRWVKKGEEFFTVRGISGSLALFDDLSLLRPDWGTMMSHVTLVKNSKVKFRGWYPHLGRAKMDLRYVKEAIKDARKLYEGTGDAKSYRMIDDLLIELDVQIESMNQDGGT